MIILFDTSCVHDKYTKCNLQIIQRWCIFLITLSGIAIIVQDIKNFQTHINSEIHVARRIQLQKVSMDWSVVGLDIHQVDSTRSMFNTRLANIILWIC